MKHNNIPTRLGPTAVERFGNNGLPASANGLRRIAYQLNQVACRQKKQYGLVVQSLNAVDAGGGSDTIYLGRFRTGKNTDSLYIKAGVVLTDYVGSTPAAAFRVDDTAGAFVTSKTVYYHGTSAMTSVVPADINHTSVTLTGLSSDTEYSLEVSTLLGTRIVYLTFTEQSQFHANDGNGGVCNPGPFISDGPVLHTHMSDLIDSANEQWRASGKHLIQMFNTVSVLAIPATTVTATTYTNILQALTSVTASSPGYTLYTTYDGTAARANAIPVKMIVHSKRTAGSGTLDVKVTDGTNEVAVTGITSAQGYYSATATIPAQTGTKWDIMARVSTGGASWEIYNVSLLEYEA